MTELPISPLARRIAEENNVDWRALAGSDAGGGVNERDVLNYLEQVMLGNQPVDPTPEPLPEGMTAWAEEPIRAESPALQAVQAAASESSDQDLEAVYQKVFAELATLKTDAAKMEQARDAAEQARTEAHAELEQLRETLTGKSAELTDRNAELGKLRTQLEGLETTAATHQAKTHEAQLELTHLRETLTAQDEELVEVQALRRQVDELKAELEGARTQTRELQEHSYALSENLNQANDASQKAKAETERLRTSHAGLEQTITELKQRPWWKLWG